MPTPPTFEEASQHITDPEYRIGAWFVELPLNWPGTETAKIHDLRYDYLKPGESTLKIDKEAKAGWKKEGCPKAQVLSFYRIIRLWGRTFQEGEHLCAALRHHYFVPCSYGQAGMVYDMRCSICGLHKSFDVCK